MQSMAPRPWAFMRSRARSVRYFRRRSQLTRCCQSSPAIPKFAPMCALAPESEASNESGNGKAVHTERERVKDRPPQFTVHGRRFTEAARSSQFTVAEL